MKKFLIILASLLFCSCVSAAEVNMPSGPVYYDYSTDKKPVYTQSTQIGSVNSVATSLARAELNGSDIEKYYMKLMDMGVTNISIQTIENGCPYRKGITPITVGGKTYTGKACTIVRYTYNGVSTGTGACK